MCACVRVCVSHIVILCSDFPYLLLQRHLVTIVKNIPRPH